MANIMHVICILESISKIEKPNANLKKTSNQESFEKSYFARALLINHIEISNLGIIERNSLHVKSSIIRRQG